MNRFYLITFLTFAVWKTIAVTLHYFSASPWGGPLVLSPDRLLPDTLFIEWGLLALLCLLLGGVEWLLRYERAARIWRPIALTALCLYCIFGQLDREVVRWLGQHMTLSYIQNYMGARDGQMTLRIFSEDRLWTGAAFTLMAITPLVALSAWHISKTRSEVLGRRMLAGAVLFTLVMVSAHQWFRPSEKRWRRIRPAVLAIAQDAFIASLGRERPRDPELAAADLHALVYSGQVRDLNAAKADTNVVPTPVLSSMGGIASTGNPTSDTPASTIPTYPLWRDDNLGDLTVEDFEALPLEERPDIVFIVFETWRGWNSGLAPHPELEEGNPELNAIIREEALYFPYMHSGGFPSVEGCMGMHLGIWPHFRKIFLSDYGHIRTKGFPEILRDFGYTSHALLGADPSFSNFTPWIERWYDAWEYNPAVHHDGPLVDRFIERYESTRGTDPRLMMMWTATTHPPYNVPDSEDIEIAGDNESRFMQAIHYTDKHLARLLSYLQAQPEWERTIVVIVGDHAQATPEQWRMADTIGALTPGHTWTAFAMLGGWHGLPEPGRYDFDTSHTDIAPTLLSALRIKAPNHFMGRDLRRVVQAPEPEHPVIAFRYGDVAWQQGDKRLLFRLDSHDLLQLQFDRKDALQYGSLPGGAIQSAAGAPEGWPVERWRDAIRFYASLLDANRLMPPANTP